MSRVERSSRAKVDATEIWAYVAQDNIDAADHLIDRIEQRLSELTLMPMSAEAVPYLEKNVRRASVGNYAIYFRPIVGGIMVMRILHGSRQPEEMF